MKPFTTYQQQLQILKDRGLSIENDKKAINILATENYYNIINGYKDLFLQRNEGGEIKTPEHFQKGTTFEDIYGLFNFDRELRMILLKYLLIFENNIKAKVAYHFSEKYKEPHAYLQMQNYIKGPNKLEKVLQLIAILSSELARKSKRNGPIKHYLDEHNGVPLWVLVNYLTIGNISNFYDCLDHSLQETIAKEFSLPFKNTYLVSTGITSFTIIDILKTANFFRNVCAHEERLYNFKLDKQPRSKNNATLLNIPHSLLTGNCFTVFAFMKLVLRSTDYKEMMEKLSVLLKQFKQTSNQQIHTQVLSTMGFPLEWESILCQNRVRLS